MGFDITGYRKRYFAPLDTGCRFQSLAKGVDDRDTLRVAHPQRFVQRQITGEDSRAHAARLKSTALFVTPGDYLDRAASRDPGTLDRFECLKTTNHAVSAVEFSTLGLTVKMTAGNYRGGAHIRAGTTNI